MIDNAIGQVTTLVNGKPINIGEKKLKPKMQGNPAIKTRQML